MSVRHFLVDRDDFHNSRIFEAAPDDLSEGQVRLRVDSFGFTANNITYAAAGDTIGYWGFFPAPDLDDGVTWGRIPVWGFADVVETRVEGVAEGERLFGYLPMSTELVIEPGRLTDSALADQAPHRASLPTVYNRYVRCATDPGYDSGREAEQMVYRPLFFTSFLIDDWLYDNSMFGADIVVLASASSKTALGVAYLLDRRDEVSVVGLTSPGNVEFLEGLGIYSDVIPYDSVDSLPDGRAALVDMSGNATVVRSVHDHYGNDLVLSAIVGLTHWDERQGTEEPLPGPAQTMFFAPSQIEKRHRDWGAGAVEERLAAEWVPFLDKVSGWVTIRHGTGADSIVETYHEVVEGRTTPDAAHVLHP